MEQRTNGHFFLNPGYIYHSMAPVTIHTVVGNCVSVCLWDRKKAFGAMNHFLYPSTQEPKEATPLYGNVATAKLAQLMLEAGSTVSDLIAQVFGGASHKRYGNPELGLKNVEIARNILRNHGIIVHSEDTGGRMGRKIAFDSGTGHAIVLKVHDIRAEDWNTAG